MCMRVHVSVNMLIIKIFHILLTFIKKTWLLKKLSVTLHCISGWRP